jgi:hypothetical protein
LRDERALDIDLASIGKQNLKERNDEITKKGVSMNMIITVIMTNEYDSTTL